LFGVTSGHNFILAFVVNNHFTRRTLKMGSQAPRLDVVATVLAPMGSVQTDGLEKVVGLCRSDFLLGNLHLLVKKLG
jgi:hypothetical protein